MENKGWCCFWKAADFNIFVCSVSPMSHLALDLPSVNSYLCSRKQRWHPVFSGCWVLNELDRVWKKSLHFFAQMVWVNFVKDMPRGSLLHFESHKICHTDLPGYLKGSQDFMLWWTVTESLCAHEVQNDKWVKFRLGMNCHQRRRADWKSELVSYCLNGNTIGPLSRYGFLNLLWLEITQCALARALILHRKIEKCPVFLSSGHFLNVV